MKKNITIILILVFFFGLFVFFIRRLDSLPSSTPLSSESENKAGEATQSISVVLENLDVPWSLVFLPTGEMVVTERGGNLKIVGEKIIDIKVPGVVEVGEGGLLGVALHPDFVSNRFLYLYFTTRLDGKIINKIVRFVFDGNSLVEEKTILDNVPGGSNHNGGRIAFGPDKFLYITTGDAGEDSLSQDKNSLAGKVLRLNDDGSIPPDNPFSSAVYSYGHRNPQGLAWDDKGRLWETEHGRSGVQSGFDEINLIEKGGNYGWPEIEGDEEKVGMKKPVLHSGPRTTWAPAGIAFYNGKLFFAGLRGSALYEVPVRADGSLGEIKDLFKDEYGRLRGVALGPENALYFTTSNQDGRGRPKTGDDKVFKIINIK